MLETARERSVLAEATLTKAIAVYTVNGLKIGLPEPEVAKIPGWVRVDVPEWFSADGMYSLDLDASADPELEGCYAYISENKIHKVHGRSLELDGQALLCSGERWEKAFAVFDSVPPEGFDPEEEGGNIFFSTIALQIVFSRGMIVSFMLSEPRP